MSSPTFPEAPQPALYRVGEVAEQLGLTLRTLKYYEELGLVAPQRTDSRYRLYTDADVQRLERIRRMRAMGLSLRTIQTIFSHPQERDAEGRQVLAPSSLQVLEHDLSQQLQALSERITAAEKELRDARALRRELQGDLQYVQQRLSGKQVGELLKNAGSE